MKHGMGRLGRALVFFLIVFNPQEAQHAKTLQREYQEHMESYFRDLYEQNPDLSRRGWIIPSVANFDGESKYTNAFLCSFTCSYETGEIESFGVLGLIF